MKHYIIFSIVILILVYCYCKKNDNEYYISLRSLDDDQLNLFNWLYREVQKYSIDNLDNEFIIEHLIDYKTSKQGDKEITTVELDIINEKSTYIAIVETTNDNYKLLDFYQSQNFEEQRKMLNWLMKHLQSRDSKFKKISFINKISKRLKNNKHIWNIQLSFFDVPNIYDIIVFQNLFEQDLRFQESIYSLDKFEPIQKKRKIGSIVTTEDNKLFTGNYKTLPENINNFKNVATYITHKLRPTKN
jgi:hypothetical protein